MELLSIVSKLWSDTVVSLFQEFLLWKQKLFFSRSVVVYLETNLCYLRTIQCQLFLSHLVSAISKNVYA